MDATIAHLVCKDSGQAHAGISRCKHYDYGDSLIHVATADQAQTIEGSNRAVCQTQPHLMPQRSRHVGLWKFLLCRSKGPILVMCYHLRP